MTAKEIRVGGVVGKTNPVGQPYASGFDGTEAFFDYINSKGGVFGRKFKLVSKLDDQSRASQNIAQCRALNEEDKVFAVVPIVTQIFACGGYLDENGIPGFGWNINAEYCSTATNVADVINAGDVADTINPGDPACDRLGLFGDKGSYLCFTCNNAAPAFIATELGLDEGRGPCVHSTAVGRVLEGHRRSVRALRPRCCVPEHEPRVRLPEPR